MLARAAIEQYLRDGGYLDPVTLGGPKPGHATHQRNDQLRAELARRRSLSDRVAGVIVGLSCLLFGGLLMRLLYSCSSGTTEAAITSAGLVAALLAVLKLLQRLWIGRETINLAASALENAGPEEAGAFIAGLYWNGLERKPSRPTSRPR